MNLLRTGSLALLIGYSLTVQATIADDEMVVIDSELAEYNGETITLIGNVSVEHAAGAVKANHVVLHASKKKEIGPFKQLQMQDHVILTFKDGETLSCAQAQLDYQTLKGDFLGNDQQEFVVFSENGSIKSEGAKESIPLVVKSRSMSIQLISKDLKGDGKLPQNNVGALIADGQITATYNNDFIINADHAFYQRIDESLNHSDSKCLKLPGMITLTEAKTNGVCRVSNLAGDVVKATKIIVDTVKRQLIFNQPKGELRGNEGPGKVDFTAKTLVWNDLQSVLTLKDQVEINQQGIGKLETTEDVRLHQTIKDQKKCLKAIEVSKNSMLTYREEDKNLSHVLKCPGPVKIDHEKMETRLLANHETNEDLFAENNQIHFEDAKGEIFSDKVYIKYDVQNGSISINKIVLQGNVKIYNRLGSVEDESVIVSQFVLADRVDFKPHTNEMIFKSLSPEKRVLFLDKTNNLQVSAPALKIIRDRATGKDSIKGSGEVRFNFLESEFEQFRKRFSLDFLEGSKKNKKSIPKSVGDL